MNQSVSSGFFWTGFGVPSGSMRREYLTKKDLAAYLKISLPTINRLMLEGIPFTKLKGKVLFRVDLIDHWLEERMVRQSRPKS